ncbi:Branched-chain alpha-keto acid dehydrogenase E1 component alpha chain [Intoshia linei]|uniref:2-oxoisovalerate dehydrogenase subunit alpha n=1 Tax=Intoshia linei TaxID=1819745 RepID=A0A177AX18_9BILA|nr:Branched-chain alpha-keto acid dehydrogenase E1 component alpha chain [Intoshia linei]
MKLLNIITRKCNKNFSGLLNSNHLTRNLENITNPNDINDLTPTETYGPHIHHSTKWLHDAYLTEPDPNKNLTVDVLRLSSHCGQLLSDKPTRLLSKQDTIIKIYKTALKLSVMDKIMYDSQRQGRISFYMTSTGEEISTISTAAALKSQDVVFTQYRELGVFLWRGYSFQNIMDQCYATQDDITKGKQMPIHFSMSKLNLPSISSPIGTQICQAAGAAYAIKLENGNKTLDKCVCVFFGDGASSQGDAHAAFNMASVLGSPIIFVCRNNGFAISTSALEQYSQKSVGGLAGRGLSYGMPAIRVDGNDVFAVYEAMKLARQYVVENKEPVFVELLTYRLGHHSTSDESKSYRDKNEIKNWLENYNPIDRLERYLFSNNMMNKEKSLKIKKEYKTELLKTISLTEEKKKVSINKLFEDVYDEMTPELKRQQADLNQHLKIYGDKYPLKQFKK